MMTWYFMGDNFELSETQVAIISATSGETCHHRRQLVRGGRLRDMRMVAHLMRPHRVLGAGVCRQC
jgi:hypothetical protein